MIRNIIFDFGGVLMDWDPRYFFKNYFHDDEKMEWFLKNIATDEWNAEQDLGRSLREGTEILIKQHPDWEKEIRAYYDNWPIMLRSDIPKNVEILRRLKGKFQLFGLTNWSEETFPIALENYDFFELFEGKIVVSGKEKLIKPDKAIFEVLIQRYDLKPAESLFIDDNIKNVETAKSLGFQVVHIQPEKDLEDELRKLNLNF